MFNPPAPPASATPSATGARETLPPLNPKGLAALRATAGARAYAAGWQEPPSAAIKKLQSPFSGYHSIGQQPDGQSAADLFSEDLGNMRGNPSTPRDGADAGLSPPWAPFGGDPSVARQPTRIPAASAATSTAQAQSSPSLSPQPFAAAAASATRPQPSGLPNTAALPTLGNGVHVNAMMGTGMGR